MYSFTDLRDLETFRPELAQMHSRYDYTRVSGDGGQNALDTIYWKFDASIGRKLRDFDAKMYRKFDAVNETYPKFEVRY